MNSLAPTRGVCGNRLRPLNQHKLTESKHTYQEIQLLVHLRNCLERKQTKHTLTFFVQFDLHVKLYSQFHTQGNVNRFETDKRTEGITTYKQNDLTQLASTSIGLQKCSPENTIISLPAGINSLILSFPKSLFFPNSLKNRKSIKKPINLKFRK